MGRRSERLIDPCREAKEVIHGDSTGLPPAAIDRCRVSRASGAQPHLLSGCYGELGYADALVALIPDINDDDTLRSAMKELNRMASTESMIYRTHLREIGDDRVNAFIYY